jgi:hypothetical protein
VIVTCCEVQLYLSESRSLKDKRQVLQSLQERIRSRFSVAVAEVEHQDLWQRATLGLATVGNSVRHGDEVLTKVVGFIEQERRVQVLDWAIEER